MIGFRRRLWRRYVIRIRVCSLPRLKGAIEVVSVLIAA